MALQQLRTHYIIFINKYLVGHFHIATTMGHLKHVLCVNDHSMRQKPKVNVLVVQADFIPSLFPSIPLFKPFFGLCQLFLPESKLGHSEVSESDMSLYSELHDHHVKTVCYYVHCMHYLREHLPCDNVKLASKSYNHYLLLYLFDLSMMVPLHCQCVYVIWTY